MYWGFKSRFHDLESVMQFKPKMVEFHLTDEDVETGQLNGRFYETQYSIHLPEYWHQQMIDPCNLDHQKENINIYTECIKTGLTLRNRFRACNDDKLLVIMHPGGMTIDPITDEIHPIEFYKGSLYKRLLSFVTCLEMIPQITGKFELLVENMPPLPWFYGGQYYSNIFCDPNEIVEYCDRTARQFCLDVSHLGLYCNYVGQDLIDAIKLLQFHVKQIHLADASGTDGEGAPIGQGNVNFKAVIQEIKEMDVAVIPETMWGHKNNFYEFRRVIEECEQWLI